MPRSLEKLDNGPISAAKPTQGRARHQRMKQERLPPEAETTLPKVLTGIAGLDAITGGGLPRGRPTLVCGTAGSGKTLLAIEFLVRGATQYGEPGLFVA